MFTCGICGKEYETVAERMACEKKCVGKEKARVLAQKKENEERERKEMHAKICEKINKIESLTKEVETNVAGYVDKYKTPFIMEGDNASYKYCHESHSKAANEILQDILDMLFE